MTEVVATRNRRKIRVGRVVSDRMEKTIVVSIERLVPQRGREEEYRERAPRRPQARP